MSIVALEVIVYTRPNMFEVQNNLFNLVGYNILESLFSDPKFKDESRNLTLYYPERFLNILEQRELIKRLEVQDYYKVKIVTHSVYILQTIKAECIRIVGSDIKEGQGLFKLSNDIVGLPNCDGLCVVGA